MTLIIINSWKRLFRNKFNMFWILLFPIALGTLFYIAFSNLNASESMNAIPVAVVTENDDYGKALTEVIHELSNLEEPFLAPQFTTEKEALDLLCEGNVIGILYSGEQVHLSISASMSTQTLNQSILEAFVEEYNVQSALLTEISMTHPGKMPEVIAAFDTVTDINREVSLQKNPDIDTYTQYYYNQIAMACLYAAMAGLIVAVENQSNLSSVAARKAASSKRKYQLIIGELFAAVTFEFLMNLFGFFYLAFLLKVGVAIQFPLAILTLFVGVLTGVSFGFFIGTFGHMGQDSKQGLLFAIIMPLCFLSGLMVGSMRIIVDQIAPFINRINPAALISDSFYSLAIFEGHERYAQNMLTLVVLSTIFIILGILKTRRSRYASL